MLCCVVLCCVVLCCVMFKPNPSAPPEPAQYDKCHACHAECTSMSPSTTPARPAKQTAAATTAPNPTQARHRSQPSTINATQSDDRCRDKLCVSKLCGDKLCVCVQVVW